MGGIRSPSLPETNIASSTIRESDLLEAQFAVQTTEDHAGHLVFVVGSDQEPERAPIERETKSDAIHGAMTAAVRDDMGDTRRGDLAASSSFRLTVGSSGDRGPAET